MGILFSRIYEKAVPLFDDPKITVAYNTNKVQFQKIMYTYLQNAVMMFNNPLAISVRLSKVNEPEAKMDVEESKGTNEVALDTDFILRDNSEYIFIEGELMVKAKLDKEKRIVTFPDALPVGQEYAIEQYYAGEFLDDFTDFNSYAPNGDKMVKDQIESILARLLVKSWAEGERNELLDIKGIMQDTDFKLMPSDRILKGKNQWIDQLDSEILQYQNRLAWMIRFMGGSMNVGRG